jgi:hypothetical protein
LLADWYYSPSRRPSADDRISKIDKYKNHLDEIRKLVNCIDTKQYCPSNENHPKARPELDQEWAQNESQ